MAHDTGPNPPIPCPPLWNPILRWAQNELRAWKGFEDLHLECDTIAGNAPLAAVSTGHLIRSAETPSVAVVTCDSALQDSSIDLIQEAGSAIRHLLECHANLQTDSDRDGPPSLLSRPIDSAELDVLCGLDLRGLEIRFVIHRRDVRWKLVLWIEEQFLRSLWPEGLRLPEESSLHDRSWQANVFVARWEADRDFVAGLRSGDVLLLPTLQAQPDSGVLSTWVDLAGYVWPTQVSTHRQDHLRWTSDAPVISSWRTPWQDAMYASLASFECCEKEFRTSAWRGPLLPVLGTQPITLWWRQIRIAKADWTSFEGRAALRIVRLDERESPSTDHDVRTSIAGRLSQ